MKYSEYIAQRRIGIPEVAFKMFAERGIEDVTMQQIADAVDCGIASLYRYYGTKLNLVIEIAAQKWREYADIVTAEYNRQNGADMNAYEEFEFMISRYIDLYHNHKELIKYDFDFALYVQHEKATKEDMVPYYESVGIFKDKFGVIMQKGYADNTIRTDIAPTQLYWGTLYPMITTAAKYAFGTVYPVDEKLDYTDALQMQMNMILDYIKTK